MNNALFVYGTLAPGRSNAHVMEGLTGDWIPAKTQGTLYQKGWGAAEGYPGLVLNSEGEDVTGLLFVSDDLPEHWARLDDFEGEGYQRIITQVEILDGEHKRSIKDAYVYALSDHLANNVPKDRL